MPDPPPAAESTHRNPPRDRGQLPLVVIAVIAVAALGVAGWALLRPASGIDSRTASPSYSDAQRAEARTKVCTAFALVRTGVTQNTNLQPPGGEADVTGALAVAANARVALYDGGQYLLARLDPATAPELADPVRTFGNQLIDIGASATAGIQNSDPAQAGRLLAASAMNTTITRLCA